ncbi:MAG: BlaI/MecI/CopY family transcriptional regulator [Candidatus Limnocylindrales bacterium]
MSRRKHAVTPRPPLANAELAVMELLWDDGKVTARYVRERLYADQKNQHGTVQRLLQRLEEKGFVERDDELPVHLFSATVSREDYATSQLELLAGRLTGGSLAPIVTRLVEQKRISRAEIDRLRAILDDEPEDPG